MKARERVLRGAAWLDEQVPGWEGEVDLRELELQSCMRCVLGQVYGGFDAVVERRVQGRVVSNGHLLTHEQARDLGFDIAEEWDVQKYSYDDIEGFYEDLTYEWVQLILERRAHA